ncbi:MAG: thiamine-phosphate pyrophosphorylase [Candidatus Omnitrophica bacterium]|nr:thiamine-phosphate pyrophosphorylase [Candidatus Omnitrophota bacterium]
MPDKKLYRILDANFNRAKEGLRVCEDVCRYVNNDKQLTRGFKDARHDLTGAVEALDILKALAGRDIKGDIGRATSPSESRRKGIEAVFWANAQRVKESLRVLEEISKLINVKSAQRMKHLRYTVYDLEQKALKKF